MGKPSSYKLSKRSDHSLNSSSSYQKIPAPMSNQKMDTIKRKKHNKTKNKIRHLFKKLKEHCETSYDTSQEVTVLSCDNNNEQNDTVINENIPVNPGLKRKLSSTSIESTKRRKSDSSLILIDDDVSTNDASCPLASPSRNKTHINCSTPINKSDSKTLENLIINNFQESKKDGSGNFNEDIINLTKEINRDSYLTIDLTADSEVNKTNNVVIDVDKTLDYTAQTPDCTLISVSNTSLSMSGDSEVTVLQNKISTKDNQMNKFARGISKLNSTEKGKLLEIIVQNIFSGCKMSNDVKNSLTKIKAIKTSQSQATETVQDTFIKEVILGETKSRNSIGSNIYHPSKDIKNKKGLRMIVIDGSNVAMEHTKGTMFSVKGLKICIDYFVRRGHVVKAFVPRFRCKYGKSSDPKLLDLLERQGLVVYTPSREIQGRICVPYDDRYIVQCAAEFDGVIVTGDNYRDLLQENPRWRFVIENRLLPFTWVDDMIMFPKDPMGRNGPTLEEFLRHPSNSRPPVVHIL